MQNHWEKVYQRNAPDELGWYEKIPEPSLNLIRECKLKTDSAILLAGAGTTNLIDALLEEGYTNIIANDISSTAIAKQKERLGDQGMENIRWIVDDLTNPGLLDSLDQIDLWHDRAVLHFFIEKDLQENYFNLLRKLLRSGGYVIIAAFSLEGAEKCSGLPVRRYNSQMISENLGRSFELIDSFDYIHRMPNGEDRKYVYTCFQKKADPL